VIARSFAPWCKQGAFDLSELMQPSYYNYVYHVKLILVVFRKTEVTISFQ